MTSATLPPATAPRVPRAGSVPVGGLLTPRTERMIRLGSLGSAVVIAVCAMVLSYAGLHDLALDAQIPPRLALLVPIMVDGLQFVGSLGVIYSTLSGLRSWYPWMLMLMGVSISAWGNWQAAPDVLTAKLLHAAAPVILALVLEELLRVMRHKVGVHAHAEAEDALQGSETRPVEPSVLAEAAADAGVVGPEVVSAPVAPPATESVTQPVAEPVANPVPTAAAAMPVSVEPVAMDTSDLAEASAATAAPSPVTAGPVVHEEAREAQGDQSTWQMRERIVSLSELRTSDETPVDRDAVAAPAPAPLSVVADDDSDEDGPDDNENSLPPYPASGPLKEQIAAVLEQDDTIPAARIARVMDREPSYVRKLVREVKKEMSQQPVANSQPKPSSGAPKQGGAGDRDLRSIDPFSVTPNAEYATN